MTIKTLRVLLHPRNFICGKFHTIFCVFHEHIYERSREWMGGGPADMKGPQIAVSESEKKIYSHGGVEDALVYMDQVRKDLKFYGELQSLQADGISRMKDRGISQLLRDVENAREGYGTNKAFGRSQENITKVLNNGTGVMLSDFEDPSPPETTNSYE